MTACTPPVWLEELEASFGNVIRTPLDRTSGTLTATPATYDSRALEEALDGPTVRGAERLAVYNRQYWFRMFDVLQRTFPLTARLLGHWLFNDYASRFLLAHPPRGWDIDRACDGFVAFFSEAVGDAASAERDAWIESARLDDAWQRVFGAPEIEPYRPSAADAEHLLEGRLTPSPAVALVEEHWPLLELRAQVLRDGNGEKAVPLPPRLPRSRWWALVRTDQGIGQLPLDAREAELFGLLSQLAVGDALAELERICEPEERVDLPRKTQMWLARSVTLDFWTGLSRR